MKAVKEKEQLQKIVDSWKNSSKNLWKLVDSGMSSTSKVGLGYEKKSNNEVLSYGEEMNRIVFNCTKEDFIDKPLYSRFSKTKNFKGVPHPLTGDYTPKPQQEIDESLYVYGKKGPQKPEISNSDDTSNEHSTCQSNDSEGSFRNPSEHSSESESKSISVPKDMSTSKSVTTNEKVVSEPKSTEVEPSCVTHIKIPRQQMKNQETHKVNRKSWNEMMERELGEGNWQQRVQLFAVRQNVNSVRPNVNTSRANVNSVRIIHSRNGGHRYILMRMDDQGHTGNKDPLDDFERMQRGNMVPLSRKQSGQVGPRAVSITSKEEPKKISEALKDDSWVYRNKKDERGVVVRNKARLVAQGHRQEEGIDYNEDMLKKFDLTRRENCNKPNGGPMMAYCQTTEESCEVEELRSTQFGLWYPRESSFDLEAFSTSDYARANLDRNSQLVVVKFLEEHNFMTKQGNKHRATSAG
ncbi:putative ribonuclease H-like domain-containing protein [Tanacetum coccineum]|uniref:Ribonuclease H-like domain-containing protein n=1 Tax=Tanacetum coccineum TaxID=301880 RepID=A0ABQ5B8F1_9ASTR